MSAVGQSADGRRDDSVLDKARAFFEQSLQASEAFAFADLPAVSAGKALIAGLSAEEELVLLLEAMKRRQDESQLEYYRPYRKQAEFHALGATFRERLLIAANQVGKTLAAGNELAMHTTGKYPRWWKGKTFSRPNHWLAGSESGELTKKGVQRILLGRDAKMDWGTGTIPRESIKKLIPGSSVPELWGAVHVKHEPTGGTSTISFKSYDQGRAKWQADTVSGVWYDEEPPEDVYMEGLTRTNVEMGPIITTFTPLLGMSRVVKRYLIDKFPGTTWLQMTLEDAEHYTAEQRAQIIAGYPEHERDARSYGNPLGGAGLVYPPRDELLEEDQIIIPKHWRRICGIDFGWTHPFAATWLAYDADADVIHVTDCYRESRATPAVHVGAIRPKGDWIPVAWPADALQTQKGTGFQLAQEYRDLGLNMLPEHAQFEETGDEGETPTSRVSVEAGVLKILQRMQTGRWKIGRNVKEIWEEKRMYHRKDGKIVDSLDDGLSGMRYAYMMLRYAEATPSGAKGYVTRRSPTPWFG